MARPEILRRIWRWYWALLLANALDLLFTYTAVERGVEEANVLLRPILLTPWPAVAKFTALGLLAGGLLLLVWQGGRAGRVLAMVRATALVYLLVVGFHLLGLLLAT